MRRSLLTIAAACMWFAGTNVMAMGTPVEVAAAAEGDDLSLIHISEPTRP